MIKLDPPAIASQPASQAGRGGQGEALRAGKIKAHEPEQSQVPDGTWQSTVQGLTKFRDCLVDS